jgi:hypothetical protein
MQNRFIAVIAFRPLLSAAPCAGTDMTSRVNRDIGFQVVASTHEFPEGGAAVSLDGGSH